MKTNQKRVRVAILISDNKDFKTNIVTRNKERHFIIRKWSIHQGNITIINIYALNDRAPKQMKQNLTELKGNRQLNNNSWILQYSTFNNGESYKQINKEMEGLNNTINHYT